MLMEMSWAKLTQIQFYLQKSIKLSLLDAITANVSVESMHAHSDADGNEYFYLDVLVDYISLSEQETSICGRPITKRPLQDGKFAASGIVKGNSSCPDSCVCICAGD